MRTTIKQTGKNEVTKFYLNEDGERSKQIYHVSAKGGFVTDEHGREVCRSGDESGSLLYITKSDDLIHVIRKDHARAKRARRDL